MKKIRPSLASLLSLAFVVLIAGAATAFGQDVQKVSSGQKFEKFKGIVTRRDSDHFLMGPTTGGAQNMVIITPDTEVKSHKKGVFRGSKMYESTHILRGLRVEVDGVGNGDGAIVADKIRFDEQDLRTAQALQSTMDPLEAEMRAKLAQQQAEQEKLAGQLQETQAVASAARSEAAAAQTSANEAAEAAKKAQAAADMANNRINGLDDFDIIKTITVNFATNSSNLGVKGKSVIDEAAAWVKTQNTKGWVVAVIGYADTTGNSARNRTLSEKRANSVIYYLVTQKGLKPNRLVQPFGAGQMMPVAENKSSAGRAKNRRVEIKLMINKGIANTVGNGSN